jgi:hypothetical protein
MEHAAAQLQKETELADLSDEEIARRMRENASRQMERMMADLAAQGIVIGEEKIAMLVNLSQDDDQDGVVRYGITRASRAALRVCVCVWLLTGLSVRSVDEVDRRQRQGLQDADQRLPRAARALRHRVRRHQHGHLHRAQGGLRDPPQRH